MFLSVRRARGCVGKTTEEGKKFAPFLRSHSPPPLRFSPHAPLSLSHPLLPRERNKRVNDKRGKDKDEAVWCGFVPLLPHEQNKRARFVAASLCNNLTVTFLLLFSCAVCQSFSPHSVHTAKNAHSTRFSSQINENNKKQNIFLRITSLFML